MAESKERPGSVQSVLRAVNILDSICDGATSIKDIAESCQLSKSTVHRLLQALSESNMVLQDPAKHQYYLGYFIARLISKTQISHEYMVSAAKPEMDRIAHLSEETTTLSILVGPKYVELRVISSPHLLRVIENREENHKEMEPIYLGATGKSLLSQLKADDLEMALKSFDKEPGNTDYTMAIKEELIAQLKKIKLQGYVVSANERLVGVMCVSAPIRNYILPTTLSIVGPESRMRPRLTELINETYSSAALISERVKQTFNVH